LYCIVFILRNTFISTHYDVDNMSKVLCSDGQTGVKRLRLPPKNIKKTKHIKLGLKQSGCVIGLGHHNQSQLKHCHTHIPVIQY